MKTVILAGGLGSRLSEETDIRPKPMVEVGCKPMIWHIMQIYSHHGFNDFVVCLGYKGHVIKEYFSNHFFQHSDVTIDLMTGRFQSHSSFTEPWRVTLIDTGAGTMTGWRIKQVREYTGRQTFMATYGDGVGDIDIAEVVRYHRQHGKLATMTAVRPPARFGVLQIDGSGAVASFKEKPDGDNSWINGGFFVLEPEIFDYIEGDQTVWEAGPLERLAREGQLMAYRHDGFWRPMDTLRDKRDLESLWNLGKAPWDYSSARKMFDAREALQKVN